MLHGSYPAHAKHVLLYMTMVPYHIIFDVVYIVNLFDVQTGEFEPIRLDPFNIVQIKMQLLF